MPRIFLLLIIGSLLTGCATTEPIYQPSSGGPPLTQSLFPSDQSIISQAAIDTILASSIALPQHAKLAIIKFPDRSPGQGISLYGYGYWRSENYLKMQQSYIDTLVSKLTSVDVISSVALLPSLLTPKEPTIPILREAAVRLQAPLLVVFRINSDIYEEFRFFAKNRAKAFATVEFVLLDVRTGIIPFTSIITKDHLTERVDSDANAQEMMMRAEQQAIHKALDAAATELSSFFSAHQN